MRLADKRQQMMLAKRIEVEVPAQDHLLVVFLGEERAVNRDLRVLIVALRQKLKGLNNAKRSTRETFTIGIFADMTQNGTYRFLGGLPVLGHHSILC